MNYHSRLGRIITTVIALAICFAMAFTTVTAYAFTSTGEKYYSDVSTLEEAVANAAAVGEKIIREGIVLLKNNGVLPLGGDEWISSFNGVNDIKEGFKQVGFAVNEVSSYGGAVDTANFTEAQKSKMNIYGKAAVISFVASGSGYVSSELEDNKLAGGAELTHADGTPFVHEGLPYEKADNSKIHKHPLMLTDNEEALLDYAANNFDKVIAIVFGGTTMEIGILEAMDEVDAVLYVGTSSPDTATYKAIADILAGNLNPSGRTNDLWSWDFTANPTWANDGNSGIIPTSQEERESYAYEGVPICEMFRTEDEGNPFYLRRRNGSDGSEFIAGLKYEESIYYGYRFYETEAAEAELANDTGYVYENRVVYPFGYGLSYTDFTWEIVDTNLDDWGREQDDYVNGGKLFVTVKVTNTGAMAGKDVVEIYAHNPYYAGGIEKAAHTLVGFEKTSEIKPGMSTTVTISVNIQDIAAFDYSDANNNGCKTYELDANTSENLHDVYGHYELRLMKDSHNYGNGDREGMVVTLADLDKDIILDRDDYSGNEVKALFGDDDLYNLLGYDRGTGKTLVEEGKMTLLQRDDFEGTWPQFDTIEDTVRSNEYFDHITAFSDYEADKFSEYIVDGTQYTDIESYYKQSYPDGTAAKEDDSEFPWAVTEEEFKASYSNWSQRDPSADLAALQASEDWVWFSDMVGLDYDDPLWDTLLNELTYDEMKLYLCDGGYKTTALPAIGKVAARYMDGSNQVDIEIERIAGDKNYTWPAEALNACTWSKDLMFQRGNAGADIGHHSTVNEGMDGWYAPATNIHRSPFGQRASEYFAEDGFLAGHLAGSVAAGMESKGIICTVKHYALNENENHRQNVHTFATEQAVREIYFKPFQIAMQEYGCHATMTSYNAIGEVHSSVNYKFMQAMTRDEWGFNGLSLTDALTPANAYMTADTMFRSGSDLILSSFSTNKTYMAPSGYYDVAENVVKIGDTVSQEGVTVNYIPDGSGEVCYTQWVAVRNAVKHILFAEADSRVVRNGVDMSAYSAGDLVIDRVFKQGTALSDSDDEDSDAEDESAGSGGSGGSEGSGGGGSGYSIAVDGIEKDDTTYKVVAGSLPEGVSLSTSGTLSGTPENSGEFSVTVEVRSYNWISGTFDVTFEVESEFEIDGDDLTALKLGDTVESEIYHPSFVVGSSYDTVTYEFVGGDAPKGISFSEDGKITGTVLTAGDYSAIVHMTATKTSTNFAGAVSVTVTERDVTVDFSVGLE